MMVSFIAIIAIKLTIIYFMPGTHEINEILQ